MRSRERGAALILVLAAVALLTVVAVELASRASADSLRATRSARDAAFRRLFDSGAEAARGLLVESDRLEIVHWGQRWNRELRFSLAPGQDAVVRLSDESGKLNIARALTDREAAPAVRDSVRRLFDALTRRQPDRNRKWKALEEKLLRRLERREPLLTLDGLREADIDITLLTPYLTCFGDGRINLNTAPKAVLEALDPELDAAMVDRIAGYRGKKQGEPGEYKPFEAPQDLMLVEGIVNRTVGADGQLRVTRNLYEKLKALISIGSSCFSARIDATVDGHRRQAWVFFTPEGSRLAFEEILP